LGNLLLTGATGFLGQATLERVLASYPDTRITLLVRGRSGQPAEERVARLLRLPVFDRWRERLGEEAAAAEVRDRVRVLDADLGTADLELPDDLTAVVHAASTVSFDPPIDQAFRTNVQGVHDLYRAVLSSGARPHVVHVSTAYVQGVHHGVVPERTLDHDLDWQVELAAAMVARANPDGYTLLSVSSAHAIAAAIYPKLPYDTFALAGVIQTGSSKYVLVVAPTLGVRSLGELLAAAKARPGQLNFSSAGVGSGTHFAGEMLRAMAGIDVVHVPFKGIPEALGETVSGRVQFFMAPIANAVNPVKDGKLVGLGVSSLERDALLPQVPTLHEAGVSGYKSQLWFGLLTGASVPRPIIARLNGEIARILSEPELKSRWSGIGIEPRPDAPEVFDRLIREDVATFASIARAANIRAD